MDIVSFNGKTYNNLEEMPADQRAAYEQVMAFMKDENNNGIPDMFEGDVIQKMIGLAANTRIVVNGQEMRGLDALPPETREKFDKAMQILERLKLTRHYERAHMALILQGNAIAHGRGTHGQRFLHFFLFSFA